MGWSSTKREKVAIMVKGGGCLDDRRCGQDQRSDHQKFLQGDATGNLGAKSNCSTFFR
jgi:hypothetical protein